MHHAPATLSTAKSRGMYFAPPGIMTRCHGSVMGLHAWSAVLMLSLGKMHSSAPRVPSMHCAKYYKESFQLPFYCRCGDELPLTEAPMIMHHLARTEVMWSTGWSSTSAWRSSCTVALSTDGDTAVASGPAACALLKPIPFVKPSWWVARWLLHDPAPKRLWSADEALSVCKSTQL